MRAFRFVSFSLILAITLSGLDFLVVGDQPKAHATTFTSSGTWTVPAGMNSATFEAWGGGGAGSFASITNDGAGGGQGGAYAKSLISVNPGDIYTVTVGVGGNNTISTGHPTLVVDPSSTITIEANGGQPGNNDGGGGGCGSNDFGSIGTTVYKGGCGANGTTVTGTGGAGGGAAGPSGAGSNASGTTPGTGNGTNSGSGGTSGLNVAGGAGGNYGGGGGGGGKTSGGTKSGGNGAPGLVVITASASSITSTVRQEINILDGILAVSSTSNAIVQLDTSQYGGTVSYYFEVVTGSASASTDSVTLTRSGTTTNDATISLAGTAANTRVRSSAFTPPASTQTQYVVKTGANHSIKAARIIIVQNGYPVSGTETQIEIGNQETAKVNTTAAALTNPKYWTYTSANWDNSPAFYAEVTKAQNGTNFTTTVTLQQDDGSFGTWSNLTTIVSDTTTAATRTRVSFTPTNGRHYRISTLESASSGGKNYSLYNAKIVVDQSPKFQTMGLDGGGQFSFDTAMTALSSTQIADLGTTCFITLQYSNSDWVNTGNCSTVPPNSASASMTALSSTRVALVGWNSTTGNDELSTFDYSSGSWTQTGSTFTVASSVSQAWHALTALSSTRVAYIDARSMQLRTYDFNGTTWSQTGSSLTITGTPNALTLAKLSSTSVAYFDTNNQQLRTYSFSGTTWSQTGSSLGISMSGNAEITGLSSSRIAYIDNGADIIKTYDFNGSTWSASQTGNWASGPTGFSATSFISTLSSTKIIISSNESGSELVIQAYDLGNLKSPTKLETQYALNNTVGAATGLQGYPTKWDSTEWFGVTNTYESVLDSTNASSSAKLQDIDNSNTDVTGSTVTGNNQVFSSTMTMPATGHQIDANITASATTVTAVRIDATVFITGAISGSNSAPSSPTLTAPSSGATGVSTTPTFTFSDTDPDSDDIQFKINLFQSDCSSTVSMTPSGDMASGQTAWTTTFNGSAGSGLTYTSSTAGSGVTFTPTAALSAGTTYCWSVSAKDPGGTNTSTTSSTQLFTTAAAGPTTDQQLRGGTYFSGGTKQPIYWAQ